MAGSPALPALISALAAGTAVATALLSSAGASSNDAVVAAGMLFWGLAVLLLAVFAQRHRRMIYRYAEPNEWLLVIQDGEMVRAGIGLRAWLNPLKQTAVRFPSSVRKVVYNASQVTKEMQGIDITGFAMFSVHRENEGPFKYFKYAGDNVTQAVDNIRLVVESLVRHHVANHTIAEIMQNRELLRNQIKQDVMSAVAGWGVWIETIEVSDVKISSQSLFQDLQAEFRQASRLRAEELSLDTQQKVSEQRLATELVVAKKSADTASERQLYEAQQKLRREEEEAKLLAKQMETARARMDQEQQLQIQALKNQQEVEQMKMDKKLALQQQQTEEELKLYTQRMDAEGRMTAVNLQKYAIDSTQRIFEKLPLKDIKVHNYMGADEAGGGAGRLLPGLQQLQQSWHVVQDAASD